MQVKHEFEHVFVGQRITRLGSRDSHHPKNNRHPTGLLLIRKIGDLVLFIGDHVQIGAALELYRTFEQIVEARRTTGRMEFLPIARSVPEIFR